MRRTQLPAGAADGVDMIKNLTAIAQVARDQRRRCR
jgi:hypothetical protein